MFLLNFWFCLGSICPDSSYRACPEFSGPQCFVLISPCVRTTISRRESRILMSGSLRNTVSAEVQSRPVVQFVGHFSNTSFWYFTTVVTTVVFRQHLSFLPLLCSVLCILPFPPLSSSKSLHQGFMFAVMTAAATLPAASPWRKLTLFPFRCRLCKLSAFHLPQTGRFCSLSCTFQRLFQLQGRRHVAACCQPWLLPWLVRSAGA